MIGIRSSREVAFECILSWWNFSGLMKYSLWIIRGERARPENRPNDEDDDKSDKVARHADLTSAGGGKGEEGRRKIAEIKWKWDRRVSLARSKKMRLILSTYVSYARKTRRESAFSLHYHLLPFSTFSRDSRMNKWQIDDDDPGRLPSRAIVAWLTYT